jgi:2-polyprenyl-3-methyl-5-hydroxy-6-metoxy-1,4-benzoquinol methylase
MTDRMLDDDAAARLVRRARGVAGATGAEYLEVGQAPEPPEPRRGPASRRLRAAAKALLRPVVRRVTGEVRQQVLDGLAPLRRELEAEFDVANRRVEVHCELVAAEMHTATKALRDEMEALSTTLHDVAFGIAPGAGLPGVAERFVELRSRVNDLDRSVRTWLAESGATAAVEPPPLPPDRVPAPFDYVAFEGRFRGSRDEILTTIRERYWDVLSGAGRVLDVGCGRGELLSALTETGIEAVGVDLDPGMVAEAKAAGLDVTEADAIAFLRDQPPRSFDVVSAIQLVEHLPVRAVRELVELARSRLRPGGVLLVETPNPTALFVLGNSFVLDPSHVWPLHPSLTTFLCEQAGFGRIEVRYFAPMSNLQVPLVEDESELPGWAQGWNQAFAHLNHVVFGPQDYGVVAGVPPEHEG